MTSGEPNRDHHLEQLVVILSVVRSHGNVLTEPLPIKWTSVSVRYYSCYQAVFTEPLPSNGYIRHNIMLLKSNYFFRIVNYVGD
jgi:hypothetical protein